MKKTEEIRLDINKIENEIAHMLNQFIIDNGRCDISINVDTTFYDTDRGELKYMGSSVKVNITI